jgi:hypothetical protein
MKVQLMAGVVAVALSSVAWAQSSTPSSSMSSGSNAQMPSTATGVGGSGSFSGWLSDYQSKNNGRISRQAYMDEVGRRWDAADANRQGLTTDQINQAYGMGTTGATAPGNMGPNNVKK